MTSVLTNFFLNFNDNVTRAGHLFKLEKQHVRTTLRLNSFPDIDVSIIGTH